MKKTIESTIYGHQLANFVDVVTIYEDILIPPKGTYDIRKNIYGDVEKARNIVEVMKTVMSALVPFITAQQSLLSSSMMSDVYLLKGFV